jgi:hypothetical protein
MKRLIPSVLIGCLALLLNISPATAAVKPGGACKQVGKIVQTAGMKYKCVKSGKKFVWSKGQLVVKATAAPTPAVKPTPIPRPTPIWYSSVGELAPKELFSYQSFDNETIQLYPWEGKKVVVLTIRKNLDPIIMGRILTALDMSYTTYNDLTNFTPAPTKTYNGKLSIAEIPLSAKNCGAGCGYLGATGIQIYEPYFQKLYEGVKNKNQFDQVLFYELGRNFWNYSSWNSRLAFKENDSVVTGFAVLMRFVTMAANDIPLSDFNSYSGEKFLETVRDLARLYLSTPDFTFSSTFAIQKSPGELGTTDLWASIMMDFAEQNGDKNFYKEFFKSLESLPLATTTKDAVKNWETALSKATKKDVSSEFANTWKMYK